MILSHVLFTVRVQCNDVHVDVFVFDREQFYGVVRTRPHKEECATLADGGATTTAFRLPTHTCAQRVDDAVDTTVLDVKAHRAVNTIDDNAYLIRCDTRRHATSSSNLDNERMATETLKLNVLHADDDSSVFEARRGQRVFLELLLPDCELEKVFITKRTSKLKLHISFKRIDKMFFGGEMFVIFLKRRGF